MRINSAKELTVYKKAYALATRGFEISRRFPAEERDLPSLLGRQEIGNMLGRMMRNPAPFLTSDF